MNNTEMSELLKLAIEQKRIPRHLYKYTTAANAIKAIEGGTVYFAQFSEFNDEYEGFAKLDSNYCLNDWKAFFAGNGIYGWDAAFLLDTVTKNPDEAAGIVKSVIEASQKNNGFLCLSTKPDNVLMWAHYTGNNKGCCLEYDLLADLDLFNHIKKIDYDDNTLMYNYLHNNGGAMEAMFHKSKQWEYEDEYRVVWINHHGVRKINDGALSRIILGPKISDDDEKEIRNKILSMKIRPDISKAEKGDNPTTFVIKQI